MVDCFDRFQGLRVTYFDLRSFGIPGHPGLLRLLATESSSSIVVQGATCDLGAGELLHWVTHARVSRHPLKCEMTCAARVVVVVVQIEAPRWLKEDLGLAWCLRKQASKQCSCSFAISPVNSQLRRGSLSYDQLEEHCCYLKREGILHDVVFFFAISYWHHPSSSTNSNNEGTPIPQCIFPYLVLF